MSMNFDYIVADPTGNITVLITAPYTAENRHVMITESFDREPDCEQVGFIMPVSEGRIRLEMMAYEFCGNATLSAAAWYAGTHGLAPGRMVSVIVDSSGADEPLGVIVRRTDPVISDSGSEDGLPYGKEFEGTVRMPVPSVTSYEGWPLVQFDGISHMIVPASAFTDIQAEIAVKAYAEDLDVQALGMMLCPDYEELTSPQAEDTHISIRPLVYVPGSETCFWEHGCATGSTAVGWYLYKTAGIRHTSVQQPGGIIRVDTTGEHPMLTGKVVFRPGK